MSYTDDPQGNLSDRVRFLVGDTDVSSPELTDNQVAFLLAEESDNAYRAAARAAEVLAAKYTKQADEKQVGPLKIKAAADKSKKYTDLARSLWNRATRATATISAGGISRAPSFGRDMMPYPDGETNRIATPDESA